MFKNLWLAFRPKTLTAAIVPIFVGTALSFVVTNQVSVQVFALTFLASSFIQIATNLFNDVIDFKKGADQETRKGPQRVTQSGALTERQVYLLAFVFVFAAFLCGIPLVLRGGIPIVAIGVISLFLAYAYTGGPVPLAYKGLGDIFVILFFGIIAVAGVFYLHNFQIHFHAIVAGLQIGFLATVLIAINNLRDVEEDRLVNKKTWAVRFGAPFVRWEVAVLVFSSFLLGLYWIFQGYILVGLLPLVLLPMAKNLVWNLFRTEPSSIYNQFLVKAAVLHLVFGLQMTVGFLLTPSLAFLQRL